MRYDKRISMLGEYRGHFYIDRNTGYFIAKESAPQKLIDVIKELNTEIKKEKCEGIHRY